MLLALANWIATDVRAFNVFTYITLRSVLATMTALVISFVIGPRMIRKLTEYKIGQSVRDDGPQTHLIKAGTPTMGGALILVSIIVTTLLWADLRNRFVWVVLLVTLGFGTVGWVDDYRKVVQRNRRGFRREKAAAAVADRPGRRDLPRFLGLGAVDLAIPSAVSSVACERPFRRPVAESRSDRALFQDRVVSARRRGASSFFRTASSSARATRSI
jgi:hypothetical protein